MFTGGAQPRTMEVTLLGEQSNVTARTNDDGTFLLKGVMPGHYSPRAVDASPQVEGHRAQLTFCRFADQPLMGRGLDVNGPTDGVLEINVAQDNAEVSAATPSLTITRGLTMPHFSRRTGQTSPSCVWKQVRTPPSMCGCSPGNRFRTFFCGESV